MNIKEETRGNIKTFTVQVINRSMSKKINVSIEGVEKIIREKYGLSKSQYNFLENKSSGALSNSKPTGKYIFEKVLVDFINDYDKIKPVKIEAEPPQTEEQKKEASSISKDLPYGLKNTQAKAKTKRKRTTKKKTTEG